MKQIQEILNEFKTISLANMDGVKLMQRIDTKFSFSSDRLPGILQKLKEYYTVLNIQGTDIFTYKTLYYDTPELSLYLMHHNERMSRYKIRQRSYIDSNRGFFEVKFKNNKGHTIKNRMAQNNASEILNEVEQQFVKKNVPIDPSLLKPSVQVNYQRITLVGVSERVTLDMDIEFVKDGLHYKLTNLVIAEVKQTRQNSSPVFKILKAEKIRETAISKYCLGIIWTNPDVKQNNFKEKIRTLKKITDDRNFN